ncbi:polysaccharide pyruvyl transferase family protein [bacterium]|nr:polysaccharide pyruvyl transferase family protein [bacterium]
MSRVVVHGAYAGDNFGDTLLLCLMCHEVQRRGYGVYVSNSCPKSMKYLAGNTNVSLLESTKQLDKAVALIYGGGGYFGEQPVGRLKWNLRFIQTHLPVGFRMVSAGKPVGVCGIDVGPLCFWPARILARRLFSKVRFLGVRNRESAEYVSKLGVRDELCHETADLALMLREPLIDEINQIEHYRTPRRRILVHPSFDVDESPEMLSIAQIIRESSLGNEHVDVCLMADRDGDTVHRRMLRWAKQLEIDELNIFPYKGPWETCALIRDSDAVITNKLHTAIVASAYGRRVISLAKHPKNIRYFKQLKREELCIPLSDFDAAKFRDLAISLVEGRLSSIQVDDDLYQKSRLNFELMNNLFDEK